MVCKLLSMAIAHSSIIFQFTINHRFLNSYLNTHSISSIFHHTIFFKNVKVSRSWSWLVKKKCHTAESSMISPSRVLLHRTPTADRSVLCCNLSASSRTTSSLCRCWALAASRTTTWQIHAHRASQTGLPSSRCSLIQAQHILGFQNFTKLYLLTYPLT